MKRQHQPRIAIALISAAVLAYEVLLMGLFSLVQWHHFAYLVVSVALLGFGVSGSLLVLLHARLSGRFRRFAVIQACLFGIASLLCYLAAQRLAFNPEELIWDPGQWLRLGAVILLLMLPFVFAANLIGLALIEFRSRLAQVYAADLIGAGIGAVCVIGLLYLLPQSSALLWISMLGFAAAAAVWLECGGEPGRAVAGLAVAALVAWLLPGDWIAPRLSPYKELNQLLSVKDTRIVTERFSPLGQLSVVASPSLPLRHAPGLSLVATQEPPEQLALFTNGDGMTAITRFSGERSGLAYLDQMTSALPYHLRKPRRVLVLGAGGGADVLQAMYHRSATIEAVELNPQVVSLVRDRFADFSGHLYRQPNVRLHLAEARGFLQRSDQAYDLIQVPPIDSFTASAAGVHGLNESFLYTVEALEVAISRLAPHGSLSLTRWVKLPPRDSLKLFATAIEALVRSGIADPAAHLLMIRGLQTSTLIVSKDPLGQAEIDAAWAFSNDRAFDLVYYPGMRAQEANRVNRLDEAYFYQGAAALLGPDRDDYLRQYKFDLTPATDDRPFHFHFVRWRTLAELIELRHRGGSGLIETGYLTLILTLLLGLILSLVLILLPLVFTPRDRPGGSTRFSKLRVFGYFAALGLGFLLLEIAMLQKFVLLLHHPLYAAAVVLASFLLSAGAGSAYAQNFAATLRARRIARIAFLAIVLLGLTYLALAPMMHLAASWSLAARIALCAALIAPLGFCMGMPFPLGLAALRIGPGTLTPWAWGINGCASVISAILASLLAIHFGFSSVILIALACYALAALAYPRPTADPATANMIKTA